MTGTRPEKPAVFTALSPERRRNGNAEPGTAGFMRLALRIAAKGTPSPNPYVGAVIVKDGKIIGRGYHKKAGMPHAEVEAINDALARHKAVAGSGSRVSPQNAKLETGNTKPLLGAAMYVNLEPCNHHGRTPPCTRALISAGIGKVVFAMKDPNPDVRGGGEEELQKHGIEIERGILESEAEKLNEVFVKYAKTKTPFVVLKAAMSMDGKIATRTGDSRWITGEKARKHAHKLRSRYDAVLVGINTVLKDDPMLTARIRGARDPVKVVLDDGLRIPANAKAVDSNLIVAASEKYDAERRRELERKGARMIVCGKERVDLRELLGKLGGMGITSVLVEGGGEVHGSFFDERLADKVVLFYAPKIIGGKEAKAAVGGMGIGKISSAIKLSGGKMKKIGEDFVFEGYPD